MLRVEFLLKMCCLFVCLLVCLFVCLPTNRVMRIK